MLWMDSVAGIHREMVKLNKILRSPGDLTTNNVVYISIFLEWYKEGKVYKDLTSGQKQTFNDLFKKIQFIVNDVAEKHGKENKDG